jgi:hypothetical protein
MAMFGKPKEWKMPHWMHHLLPLIHGVRTEAEVVEFMNDHDTVVQVNAPRAMMCVSVKSQVGVLERLHAKGLIG